jgi:hypothetical protein
MVEEEQKAPSGIKKASQEEKLISIGIGSVKLSTLNLKTWVPVVQGMSLSQF